MRSIAKLIVCGGLAASAALAAVSAEAGSRHRDRVYADSFGNLIVDSAAGYKRIIVGQGSQAEELAKYLDAGQPPVVEYEYDGPGAVIYNEDYRVYNNRGVYDNSGVFNNRGVFRNRGVYRN